MLFYWTYSLPDYTWIHCSKFIILNLIPSGRFIPMGGYTAGEAALVISVTLGPVCWPSHLLGQLKDGLILCLLALPSALLLPPITALLVAFSFWSVLYQHWHQRGESCFSASDKRTSSSSPFCSYFCIQSGISVLRKDLYWDSSGFPLICWIFAPLTNISSKSSLSVNTYRRLQIWRATLFKIKLKKCLSVCFLLFLSLHIVPLSHVCCLCSVENVKCTFWYIGAASSFQNLFLNYSKNPHISLFMFRHWQ